MSRKKLSQPHYSREQLLLKVLVERYIRDGQPVGSKALAEDMGLNLSPATVRNVLSELEEQGFLQSLHTSSGRVPTAAGYRVFINHLLQVQDLSVEQIRQLQEKLSPAMEMTDLFQFASSLLSDVTSLVGIVTLPSQQDFVFKHIEFLPLSGQRLLVVLVLNDREVQNRILYIDQAYTATELQTFANYLNQLYAGKDLTAVQIALKQAIARDREEMDVLLREAVKIANQVLPTITHDEGYVLAGQDNLLQLSDQQKNVQTLCELYSALKQKQDILELFNKCVETDGVQIFIGEESGYSAFVDYSVVSASYSMEGKVLGVLGVIGPTRMHYDRVISVVDVTAKLLTAALNQNEKPTY